jgi:hypothetical protein
VLSNGHASMLLWSILHLTGVHAVDAEYERLGQPAVTLDDIRRSALRMERPTGAFVRQLPLPQDTTGEVLGSFCDGVLELRVPKTRDSSESNRL